MAARQASRGLDLIRRAWGWYLNNPYGTQSTCIEGYLADGTWGYRDTTGYDNDFSYTSHAHGWSTGPTDALTSYIVGLTITAPSGTSWSLAPQFGDLTSAEAGFTTPLGKFSAKWTKQGNGYSIVYAMPPGTTGAIRLPTDNAQADVAPKVTVDGVAVAAVVKRDAGFNSTAGTIDIDGEGGDHTVVVTF